MPRYNISSEGMQNFNKCFMFNAEAKMGVAIKPDETLDVRSAACSLVMAKTKQALSHMEAGSVLEVLTTDSCTEFDIPTWVERTGKELLSTVKEEGVIKFYIKKL
jgi:tRNA 2-thiouridine synthesizing protein A